MLTFLKVALGVYLIAINVFGFTLVLTQKNQKKERATVTVRDSKLVITAVLGGATGIFVSIFVLKYRLQSMLLMVVMPVVIFLNVYMVISFYCGGFLWWTEPEAFLAFRENAIARKITNSLLNFCEFL